MKFLLSIILPLFFSFVVSSQNGQLDPTFNPDDIGLALDGASNYLNITCKQPDGKVLIGGNQSIFNTIVGYNLTRVDSLGIVDPTFNMGAGFNMLVHAIALQADGKIIVGGSFTVFNGQPANHIIRLNADGSRDMSFDAGTGFDADVFDIAVQADGKIIVAGEFYTYMGNTHPLLVRLHSSGGRDNTFSPAINGIFLKTVSLLPDQTIMIGGAFDACSGIASNNIARLNSDGSNSNVFNSGSGFNAEVNSLEIRSDGKMMVGGAFTSYQGATANRIIGLNANGTVNTYFSSGSGFSDVVNSISFGPNHQVMVGGSFTTYKGLNVPKIILLDSTGLENSNFIANTGIGPNNYITSLNRVSNDKTLVTGLFSVYNGRPVNYICGIKDDGSISGQFNPNYGANDYIVTAKKQSNGKVLLGGAFSGYNYNEKNALVSINENGSIDTDFQNGTGFGFNDHVENLLVQDDGKIMVVGSFTTYNGSSVESVVRLNVNGTLDNTFSCGNGSNNTGTTYAVARLQNGKYVVAGAYTEFNNLASGNITGLNSNGSIDNSFHAGSGTNLAITSMLDVGNNKLLISGFFTTYNGTTVNRLARINYNATIDSAFNIGTGANNTVREIFQQADGKILVGGNFTIFNGVPCNHLVRLNADGSIDPTFHMGTGFNGAVYEIIQQTNGKLILTGYFNTYNGISHPGIVRLYPNGTLDPTFLPVQLNTPSSNMIHTITGMNVVSDQSIIISGDFFSVNGTGKNRVAKLKNCVTAVGHEVVTACDSFTWIDGITYTASNHDAFYTIMSNQGCDSLVYLDLTINYSSTSSQFITACESYTWPENDQTYTVSGLYRDTLVNAQGCDSIITLHLTIHHTSFGDEENIVSCYSYTWPVNGINYTSSGTYIDSILNFMGCDSIVTLNLTINTLVSTIVETDCYSYTWDQTGITYTESGIYADSVPNLAGCDSVFILDLTIGVPPTNLFETACGAYNWNQTGMTYTESGIYTDTLPSYLGCDSVVVLNLIILNHTFSSQAVYTAEGFYIWPVNGITYTTSGDYTYTIVNSVGCDSVITLDLYVFDLDISSFSMPSDVNNCTGSASVLALGTPDFIFDLGAGTPISTDGYSLIDSLCPGIYSLSVTDGNGDTLSVTIIIPTDSNYIFNDPFSGAAAIDSLGQVIMDCDIIYSSIDTAFIESVVVNGNIITVVWNIVDVNGSHFDTTSYVLSQGNGIYNIQLSIFCPFKSEGQYFTVSETIYFENGNVSLAGNEELEGWNAAIFPNPSSGLVKITFDDPKAYLTVMDIQGKIIMKEEIQSGKEISLEGLTDGIYLFDLSTKQSRVVKKIMKNKI